MKKYINSINTKAKVVGTSPNFENGIKNIKHKNKRNISKITLSLVFHIKINVGLNK